MTSGTTCQHVSMLKHEHAQMSGNNVPQSTVERRRTVRVPGIAEARALPATVDVPTAASFFGVGRLASYRACRDGTLPFEVLRIGRRLRVTKKNLLAALGVDDDADAAGDR